MVNAIDNLQNIFRTVQLVRQNLTPEIPLIGFAGSPWTCATYMVEGGASKSFSIIKTMLYEQPAVLHQLLQALTKVTIDYLNEQIRSGAQVIMLFDTWGGVLSHAKFPEFSLNYLAQIARGLIAENQGQDCASHIFY